MFEPRVKNGQTDLLMKALLSLESTDEAYRFFEDLRGKACFFLPFCFGQITLPVERSTHLRVHTDGRKSSRPAFALFIWAKMCYNVPMRRGADPLR